jgi:hypothetical protein
MLACLIAREGSCIKTKRRSDINTWKMDDDDDIVMWMIFVMQNKIQGYAKGLCFPRLYT